MIKDILESFRANWLSRLSSPLFASLSISWAIWNYRLIATLFTNQDIQWRFAYIDRVLYPTVWHHIILQVALPLATALFYIYVFPIPARGVFRYTLQRKVELNDLARQIEGQRLLTQEEALSLREEMAQIEADRVNQEEKYKKEIDVVRSANVKLSKQISDLKLSLYLARAEGIAAKPDQARRRIQDYITSRPLLLQFNMKVKTDQGSKRMMLGEGGNIIMGNNQNEHAWDVGGDGKLTFLDSNGAPFSEFTFDPERGNFRGQVISTGQPQLLSPTVETTPR